MRYQIQFYEDTEDIESFDNWTMNAGFCRIKECQSNDESKIMSLFVDFCKNFPKVVSRHKLRIFDNYLYDWVVMTSVPDQFEPYNDPICIFWNHYLPDDHPILEFKNRKK